MELAHSIILAEGQDAVPLTITITNTGKLPAFFVQHKTAATFLKIGDSFASIRNDMCDNYRTSPSRSGTTIFPGETVIKGGFTSDEYPAFLKSEWDSLTGDKVVVVYGCVDYRFPEGKERHQSRFANAVGIKRKIGTLDRISSLPPDPTTADIGLLPIEIGDSEKQAD